MPRRIVDHLARLIERGDDPGAWSIRAIEMSGTEVRVHALVGVLLVVALLSPIVPGNLGIGYVLAGMVGVAVVLLVRESAGILAAGARHTGIDRVVLLPWGGVREEFDEFGDRGSLTAAVAAMIATLVLAGVTSGSLAMLGQEGTIVFNPLRPIDALGSIEAPGSAARYWLLVTLWMVHAAAVLTTALHVIPMRGLDGGEIVRSLASRKMGQQSADTLAGTIGVLAAMVFGAAGLALGVAMVVVIAAVCGVWSWSQRSRSRAVEMLAGEMLRELGDEQGSFGLPGDERREDAQAESPEEPDPADELDRLLGKISAQGMSSLTGREREALERLRQHKARGG